jgi:hypothetical protein
MNEQIREIVREKIATDFGTAGEFAKVVGIQHPNLSPILTGQVGGVTANWQKILDALGLQLTVIPKE